MAERCVTTIAKYEVRPKTQTSHNYTKCTNKVTTAMLRRNAAKAGKNNSVIVGRNEQRLYINNNDDMYSSYESAPIAANSEVPRRKQQMDVLANVYSIRKRTLKPFNPSQNRQTIFSLPCRDNADTSYGSKNVVVLNSNKAVRKNAIISPSDKKTRNCRKYLSERGVKTKDPTKNQDLFEFDVK